MNTFGACCFVGILICALAQQDEMINYQNCSFQKLAIKAGSVIFGADICSRSTFTEEKSGVFTHLVTNVITGSVADQLGIREGDLLLVLGLNWETPSVEDLHLLTEQSSQQVQRIFSRLDEGRKFLLITASDGSETVTYVEALIRPTVVSCGIPPSVSYAQPNTTNAISFPNSVTYTCVSGYSLISGNAIRQCLAGGKFSGNPPVCTPRIFSGGLTWTNLPQTPGLLIESCGIPPSVDNARPNTTNALSFPNSVTYTCVPGYSLTSGNATRQCLAGGKFSGNPPVCTRRLSRLPSTPRRFKKSLRRWSSAVEILTTETSASTTVLTPCLFSKPTHVKHHGFTQYLTLTGGNVVLGPINSNNANFQKHTCLELDLVNKLFSRFDFYECPNQEYIFLGSSMNTNVVCQGGPTQQSGLNWWVPFDYRFEIAALYDVTQLGSREVCLSSTSWTNGATVITQNCDSSTNFICYPILNHLPEWTNSAIGTEMVGSLRFQI